MTISTQKINELTAALTNQSVGKAATKDAASKRFLKAAVERSIDGEAILAAADPVAALQAALNPAPVAAKAPKAPKPAKEKAPRPPRSFTRTGLAAAPRIKKSETLRADGLVDGGVDAILIDAVKRGNGALHSELCEMVGWKKCDRRLRRAADISGVKLIVAREGKDHRFSVA
jgi:hypothetical protein